MRAITAATQVGQAKADVIATDLLRALCPRLSSKATAEIAAIVHNTKG
jgi:hypothetical protein